MGLELDGDQGIAKVVNVLENTMNLSLAWKDNVQQHQTPDGEVGRQSYLTRLLLTRLFCFYVKDGVTGVSALKHVDEVNVFNLFTYVACRRK